MNNALFFILDLEARTAFGNAFRNFFAFITKYVYIFFSGAIDLMYDLAEFDFKMSDVIDQIGSRIFNLLIIFMLFKVSFSFLTYLVNPEVAMDKDKGVAGIIKRIIISIILLISINPIFTVLKELQTAILADDIITKTFSIENGEVVKLSDDFEIVGTRMNSNCPSQHYIYTTTRGDRMALLLFRPFLQPESKSDIENSYSGAWDGLFSTAEKDNFTRYCGIASSELDDIKIVLGSSSEALENVVKEKIPGPNSAEGLLLNYYYNLSTEEAGDKLGTGDAGQGTGGDYFFDFNFVFALIAGVVALLIIVSFCFDVVIRSLNLIVLQIVAPIPIISYISPKGKSSELLGNWGKKIASVWASLFIRIIILSLAIMLIDSACNSITENSTFDNVSLLKNLFIILGTLMFAKKLPKLLEELFPGLKLDGGFKLNPLKRINEDTLAMKEMKMFGAYAGAKVLGGTTNLVQRSAEGIADTVQNGFSLRRLGHHTLKTAGSTIAGAQRAGFNALGRTHKDGKMFSGMWNGYQTSMYSKIQREDNIRKAGLEDASLGKKIMFAAGSAVSDVARYVGVLNKGQREYLNAAKQDELVKRMEADKAEEKRVQLEPFQIYSKYASRIKARIDNHSDVKKAQEKLEDALATGKNELIIDARRKLEVEKDKASKKLFESDDEVKDLVNRMSDLRVKNSILTDSKYDFKKADGTFSSGAIYNTESTANVIERQIDLQAKYDVEGYKRSEEEVVRAVHEHYKIREDLGNWDVNHNENSVAKGQNVSRMNNEVQPPGLKPSAAPMQSRMTDSSQYSNLDD